VAEKDKDEKGKPPNELIRRSGGPVSSRANSGRFAVGRDGGSTPFGRKKKKAAKKRKTAKRKKSRRARKSKRRR